MQVVSERPAYLLLLAAAGCLMLTSCNKKPSRVVSAIPVATGDAMYVSEHAGLAERAAANDLHVYWNGPSGEGGIARQVALVERAVHNGDFGVIISPASAYALNSVIARAVSAHVPVVVIGPPLGIASYPNLSYVTSDVERTGALAAQRIHEARLAREQVLLAGIDPALPSTQVCARSLEVELKRSDPQARVVARLPVSLSSAQSALTIENALEDYPDVTVIYALDLNDARGAIIALQSRKHAGSLRIIGDGYSLDTIYALRKGQIDSLVIPDMRAMAKQAIDNLVLARKGEAVPAQITFQPSLLTRENIDRPAVQEMIKLDWRR